MWTYLSDRCEFLCQCGVGHYPVWTAESRHGCCEKHCCMSYDFPGRSPRKGDIALCGRGLLGIITSADQIRVDYPGGDEAMAWHGFHLSNARAGVGHQWSSRNPCILGNVAQFASSPANNIDWAETLYTLARSQIVKNWEWTQPKIDLTASARQTIETLANFYLRD